jgi:hypothetical protein
MNYMDLTEQGTLIVPAELLDDEPACENRNHNSREYGPCSVEVTHRIVYSCGPHGVVCQNTESVLRAQMADPRNKCGNCTKPILVCWRVHTV